MARESGRVVGTTLAWSDYAAMARAFGLHAERITDQRTIQAAENPLLMGERAHADSDQTIRSAVDLARQSNGGRSTEYTSRASKSQCRAAAPPRPAPPAAPAPGPRSTT